jgi:ubiquitin-activating enzyme E1
VTDMDSIEKSNLNRQFLFRDTDIGQPKSIVACRAAAVMNPQLKLVPYNIPVGTDTEATFDRPFWSSLDLVVNALDTWSARLYVDSRCVEFRKPLLESGTLGATGHTQIIVPHMTLNFGAVRIQKEVAVPSCTIHHFPHSIQHTMTWAREQFDTLFVSSPEDLNRHTIDPMYMLQLLERMPKTGQVEVLRRLLRIKGLAQRHPTLLHCVQEARCMFEEWFCSEIKQLLVTHPADKLDEDGGRFWAPPRRAPVPIEFDFANPLHVAFITATTGLLIARHRVVDQAAVERSQVLTALGHVEQVSFPPVVEVMDDSREAARLASELGVGSAANNNNALLFNLQATKFEKDDDTNHHVDFLHCVANLRAINYGITPIERLEAKKLAGNIVPAMVTTTCSITGLVLMQLYTLLQRPASIERYKEANLDLATNLLAFAEPQPCTKTKSTPKYRAVPEGWTLWDAFEIRLGDCSIARLATWLSSTHGCTLKAVTCEGTSLFRSSDKATREVRAKAKITDIYRELKVRVVLCMCVCVSHPRGPSLTGH